MSTDNQSSKSRWPRILLISFAVLIGLVVLAAYFGGKDLNKRIAVAETFCDRVNTGEFQSALILTSKSFQAKHSADQLKAMLSELGGLKCVDTAWQLADRGQDGLGAIAGDGIRMAFIQQGDDLRIEVISKFLMNSDSDKKMVKTESMDQTPEKKGGFSISFTTAKYKNARITLTKDKDAPAISEVPHNVRKFYCQADVAYAPPKTKFSAAWFYLGESKGASKPMPLVRRDVTSEEQSFDHVFFEITRSEHGFLPAGAYAVRLLINDKEQQVIEFNVTMPSIKGLLSKASSGDVAAQFDIYHFFTRKQGKENDLNGLTEQEAVDWLHKSAEGGYTQAQLFLGEAYVRGDHGLTADPVIAMQLFKEAAEQGMTEAAYNLSVGYRDGLGIEQNLEKAVVWVRKAAEGGMAEAQFNLGLHYLNGSGVPKDKDVALKWLRKAAAAGFAPAIKILEGSAQ